MINFLNRYDNKTAKFLSTLLYKVKDDTVSAIAAQLSYFLVLSIFPFLIFFLNILSYTPIAREDVLHSIIMLFPIDSQGIISTLIFETISTSNQTLLSLSALTGLWAASKGIMALIRVLNKAYDAEENRGYFKLRIMAIIFTIAFVLLLITVLLTLVFGEVIANMIFDFFGISSIFITFWQYCRIIISISSMILIFALIYKCFPDIGKINQIKFKDTLYGAIFASIGWIITSTLFSYYVNNFGNYGKTYGSLGGIIALMIWLYLSSIIIILGGEINATVRELKP